MAGRSGRVGAAFVLAFMAPAAAPAAAQIRFGEPVFHPAGADARRAITADVDGDGHADIVTANSESQDLSLLLGDGNGGFAPEVRLPLAIAPLPLVAGDFNADGNVDLCAAERGGANMVVLLGDGTGGFPLAVTTRVGSSANRIAAADYDGDGLLDVVAGFPYQASAFFGDGAGGFAPAAPIGIPATHQDFAVDSGDFDEDGLPDVIVSGRRRPALGPPVPLDGFVFLGTGSRTFAPGAAFPLAPDGTGQGAAEAADLDGDSHLDLLAADPSASALDLSFGNGRGQFAPAVRIAASPSQVNVAVADLTADGGADLATVQYYPALSGFVSRGDGSGGFLPPESFPINRSAHFLVAADFDEDHHADLAILVRGAGSIDDVGIFLNRSPELCAAGTVNAGAGALADVLYVNDSAGGQGRRFLFRKGDPILVSVGAPPLATRPSPFALFVWAGVPPLGSAAPLPFGIGAACWPMPLGGGSPQPAAVWNNTGRAALGAPTFPSTPAPSIVLGRPAGLGRAATFSLQGIIADPGSAGTRRASVTNAIVVEVR